MSFFNGLNRHLVLHGEDSSYGTELFSLKALAILGWVRWVTNLPDLMSPG